MTKIDQIGYKKEEILDVSLLKDKSSLFSARRDRPKKICSQEKVAASTEASERMKYDDIQPTGQVDIM